MYYIVNDNGDYLVSRHRKLHYKKIEYLFYPVYEGVYLSVACYSKLKYAEAMLQELESNGIKARIVENTYIPKKDILDKTK